ncbi:MAG: DMT family transporter [Bacteroidota bacterium]
MKSNKTFIYLLLILAMVFWSFSYIWTQNVFKYLNPLSTVFIRLVIASLFFVSLSLILGKFQRIESKDRLKFLLLAFFEPLIYYLGESYGLKYVAPTVAAIIISTIPLFVPFFMFFLAKEPIKTGTFFGIFIAFVGVLMVVLNKDLSFAASPLGIMFLMIAVASVMGYSYILQTLGKKYNAFTIISIQNVIGIFYFLPLVLLFDTDVFKTINITSELVMNITALAVFASALAFFLFTIGTQHIGVTKASIFTYLVPIFTALLSYFMGKETFTPLKINGILVVILGLSLSQLRLRTIFTKNKKI